MSLYRDEVIPGFAARGMRAEAGDYVAKTVERFDNPFLDHRLADIVQNHRLKIERRVAAFCDWVAAADPALPLPRLTALSRCRRGAIGGLARSLWRPAWVASCLSGSPAPPQQR